MNRTTRSLFDSVAVAHFVVMACIIFTCGSCSQPNDNASLPFDPSPDNIAVPVTGVPVPNRATAPSQEPVPKTFATWFAEGATALEEGDNETAVIAYTKAIEIDPKSAETLNARGVAFLRMHRTSLALKDFSSAIDLSPAVPKYYGNRALVYGDKNEHSRSIADLTKAIDLDPRSPSWYRQRSEAYQSHGNDALSQADTIKAERLENSSLSSNSSDPPEASTDMPKEKDSIVSNVLEDDRNMRRTWHDSTGKFSVEATFLSADDNTVTLQKVDGEEVKLPHNRLCKEDIDFLNHYIGNSKTPGDGKASPHPPAKIPRETKLAVVEKERARFASPFNNSIADATAAIADIQAKIGRLEKLGVKSQRSEKSYRELTEKLASEKQRLQKLNQELETINDRYKQQELAIIAEDLLPGEGKPIRVEDRWYTKEQFDELVAKQDAVKNQGKFRETGIQLAEWVITNLQQSYEMSADFNSVILIREARVRFVRPSAATVYSLAPTENQVVLRGSINDSSTDDSFSFTVSWKTRGGQVFQKNGYVEIGYGRDGTAYLLGVDMPFLDNPMNGAMFVTRSTLDEAIGKAFGR